MWSKLLEGAGGQLAQRWVLTILTPAFVFWAGALATLLLHDNSITWRWGLAALVPSLSNIVESVSLQLPDQLSTPLVLVVFVGAFVLVATSTAVAQSFVLPLLRLAEGYWPSTLSAYRNDLVAGQIKQIAKDRDRRRELFIRGKKENLTRDEANEFVWLDQRLRRFPTDDNKVMPTRLGNILRAAEAHSTEKYKLDAIICWPRLWLVLPQDVKDELTVARARLDNAALMGFWGLLFMIWSVWIWWAPFLGLLAAFVAYRALLSAAETYADLVESTFDMYRTVLYQALRWPFPGNPKEELREGARVTEYLWRGPDEDQTVPIFVDPNELAAYPGSAPLPRPMLEEIHELRREIKRLREDLN